MRIQNDYSDEDRNSRGRGPAAKALLRLLAALSLCGAFAAANGPLPGPQVEYAPGQALVKLAKGRSAAEFARARFAKGSRLGEVAARFGVRDVEALFPRYGAAGLERLKRGLPGQPKAFSDAEYAQMEDMGRWVLLRAGPGCDPEELAAALAQLPEVELAEPNYIARLTGSAPEATPGPRGYPGGPANGGGAAPPAPQSAQAWTPDDPMLAQQWGLAYIHAQDAWAISRGSAAQIIAIIDTGVDMTHPDLAAKIWTNPKESPGDANGDGRPGVAGVDDDGDGLIDEDGAGRQPGEPGYDPAYAADDDENGYIDDFHGWNWVGLGQGFDNNDPSDDNGHGTHCAGIAAAATNNGVGIAGACPDCTVMPLKAFQSSGTASFSDIAKAVDYAYRNGATVISMSFCSYADSSLMRNALSLAYNRCVLVAAAGNDRTPRIRGMCNYVKSFRPAYPADYSIVVSVMADSGGFLAPFTNCEYLLSSPGVGILSTLPGGAYASWSGTSMAAPLVAGVAGLLRAYHATDPEWAGPDEFFCQIVQTRGDAYQALTYVSPPDIRFVASEVKDAAGSCPTCDSDGRVDSGETVDLVVTLRNLGWNATGVTGTLTTTDSLATVVNGTSNWGAVGPNALDDNADNPFRVAISPTAANNRDIVFTLNVTHSGGGGLVKTIVLTVIRGIEKSGIITADETWTKDNIYLIVGPVRVNPGVTLTIQPGTHVQGSGGGVFVQGTLKAVGTTDENIVFSDMGLTFQGAGATFDGEMQFVDGTSVQWAQIERCSVDVSSVVVYFAKNHFFDSVLLSYSADIRYNLFEGKPILSQHGGGTKFNTIAISPVHWNVIGGDIHNNNILSVFEQGTSYDFDVSMNYWGTTDPDEISQQILDFFDGYRGELYFQPFLTSPEATAPPVVSSIELNPVAPVGPGILTLAVEFSRSMDTSSNPGVLFGPSEPYTSHAVDVGGIWLDDHTWQCQTEITAYTGDGQQQISVIGAQDLEGFPIPSRDYRFGFEIVTSGTSSAQLQASGGLHKVDLSWHPSDLSTLAGYNVYRAPASGGAYTKLNSALVAQGSPTVSYSDLTAEPGVVNYYVFRVVNSEMAEGPDSDEASAAALDDVPPVVTHTAVTSAPAGVPITISASITDNVATPTAKLYYRQLGSAAPYTSVTMINAAGSQFTANVPAASAAAPGVDYYIEATDGASTVYHGTAAAPHQIAVLDKPSVAGVSPGNGTMAGGTAITVTGTNFQPGCTVAVGGTAATGVTRVDGQTLTAVTPAHYPMTADVTVTNPNAASGTLTRAFTFTGSATIVRLPTQSADRMSTTTLAITTPGVEGALSATFEFTYDPAVLAVLEAGTGSLTSGWSASVNSATPGRARLSLAGTSPASGAGSLAQVQVSVVGAPAATSPLTWVQATINDGAVPVTAEDGLFTTNNSFTVSGTVSYYIGGQAMSGTTVTLDGAQSYSQATAADGTYAIANAPSDNYALAPAKTDGVAAGAISALDASLVLQHDVGQVSLSADQQTAGDVNGSGSPNAADAASILRYAVGLDVLPFQGVGRVWAFSPATRQYDPLNTSQIGQDFSGILIGDTTGNWAAPAGNRADRVSAGSGVSLATGGSRVVNRGVISVDLTALEADSGPLGMEFVLTYDPTLLQVGTVSASGPASGWLLAANAGTPGSLRLAMAGSQPISATGRVVDIAVTALRTGSCPLGLAAVSVNEGRIPATVTCSPVAVVVAATADFNGDGKADILWRNGATGELYAWYMDGAAHVGGASMGAVADLNWRVSGAGDFNGDGKPDILWRNASTGENYAWYMDGPTRAGGDSIDPVADASWSVAGAGDFNGDGKPDILWRNYSTGENFVWYMNGVAHAGGEPLETVADVSWKAAGAADFTGDGKPDVLWRNAATGQTFVWTMDGATRVGGADLGVVPLPWEAAGAADFNGDGKTDILWRNSATGKDYVWYMDGLTRAGGSPLETVADLAWRMWDVSTAAAPVLGVPSDFDGDGKADVLWRNSTTGDLYVWTMDGVVRKGAGASIGSVADASWKVAGMADFNADGKTDVLWRNHSTGANFVWYMNGLVQNGGADVESVGDTSWLAVGTGDFNSDGKPDILWRNCSTGENYVWYMDGVSHSDGVPLDAVADPDWKIAGAADFDGDGKPDILWRNTATGQVYIWTMDGAVHVGGADLGIVPLEWEIAWAADYNGDGKPDILWRNYATGENYVWYIVGAVRTGGAAVDPVGDLAWRVVTGTN